MYIPAEFLCYSSPGVSFVTQYYPCYWAANQPEIPIPTNFAI